MKTILKFDEAINYRPQARVPSFLAVVFICLLSWGHLFLSVSIFAPLVMTVGLLLLLFLPKYAYVHLRKVWPLFILLGLGILGAWGHEAIHIFRDIVFAVLPLSLFFMGVLVATSKKTINVFRVLMVCALVLAVNHLAQFVLNPELLSLNLDELRSMTGHGSGSLVVLMLVLGLFRKRIGLPDLFPKWMPASVVLPIFIVSFVMSYSRTGLLIALLLGLSLAGVLSNIRLRSVVAIAFLSIVAMVMIATTPNGEEGTFRSKLASSFSEISVQSYTDEQDINLKWRGFETAQLLDAYATGDVIEQVLGQGFGALVDLGIEIKLGDDLMRFIPIFHNGYAYVLLKYGIAGLLCYLLFFLKIFRVAIDKSIGSEVETVFQRRLLLGLLLSLIFTMYVVGGMAEAHDFGFVFLMGYLSHQLWMGKLKSKVTVHE